MYNAEVREKVGGLHLMNPTNFFRVVGYMMLFLEYFRTLSYSLAILLEWLRLFCDGRKGLKCIKMFAGFGILVYICRKI